MPMQKIFSGLLRSALDIFPNDILYINSVRRVNLFIENSKSIDIPGFQKHAEHTNSFQLRLSQAVQVHGILLTWMRRNTAE
jgi:hypothetical protein